MKNQQAELRGVGLGWRLNTPMLTIRLRALVLSFFSLPPTFLSLINHSPTLHFKTDLIKAHCAPTQCCKKQCIIIIMYASLYLPFLCPFPCQPGINGAVRNYVSFQVKMKTPSNTARLRLDVTWEGSLAVS